jgi:hypothetical protein
MLQPHQGSFPYQASRNIWDDLIQRYGRLALLRQPGIADRMVIGIVGQFSALERMGGVSNPMDRKVVLSATSPVTGLELDPAPSEKDVYVTLVLDDSGVPVLNGQGEPQAKQLLKIVAPPMPITEETLHWRLQVRA